MIYLLLIFNCCHLTRKTSENSLSQENSVEILQGTWKVDGEAESYMVFEDQVNYSIVVIDENIIVRKRFFGFSDELDSDSLDLRNLKGGGFTSSFLLVNINLTSFFTIDTPISMNMNMI